MDADANGVRMNPLKSVCICVLGREMVEKGKDIEVINTYLSLDRNGASEARRYFEVLELE